MGGVDRGGRRRDLSLSDMAAISGSWDSYIFTSLANFRTPEQKPNQKGYAQWSSLQSTTLRSSDCNSKMRLKSWLYTSPERPGGIFSWSQDKLFSWGHNFPCCPKAWGTSVSLPASLRDWGVLMVVTWCLRDAVVHNKNGDQNFQR